MKLLSLLVFWPIACGLLHAQTVPAGSAVSAEVLPLVKRPQTAAQVSAQADALLKLMTPEERFELVCGGGMAAKALPRLGLPGIKFTDASAGIRIENNRRAAIEKTTAFPCTQLLAAAWNPDLAFEYGKALGEECRGTGLHVLLGPGVNILRASRNGRNFEYMGEDPYLASRVVERYVCGVQGEGVLATVKHFVCNNSDYKRRSMNAVVDERALHEIYLPAFQAAVDAGVWSVMTSYNLVNGEWMGENKALTAGLLREGLGFRWLVMSDWTSTWYGENLLVGGVDLDMPRGDALQREKDRFVGRPEVDRMAHSILRTFIASGVYELEMARQFMEPERMKLAEHKVLARRVNEEGVVLLQNNGALPLKPEGKILVTGNFAQRKELSGGGSAHVQGYDLIPFAEEAEKRFGKENVTFNAAPGDDEIKAASAILVFAGIPSEGEDNNRDFGLPDDNLIARCAKNNPRTIVHMICGGAVAMDWKEEAAAIVWVSFGGQEGAPAVFDLLLGKKNPSGKLPFSMEAKQVDSVAFGDDGVLPNERVYASPLFVKGKTSFHYDAATGNIRTYDVVYKEGVFVGYRGYDARNLPVRFPFGHGLSYTQFAYGDLKLKPAGKTVAVEFSVRNTGGMAGAEVAQVYVGDPQASVPRPPKELKGFQKVFLQPGESRTLRVELPESAFQFWSPATKQWTMEPGEFVIQVGGSSRDIRLREKVSL